MYLIIVCFEMSSSQSEYEYTAEDEGSSSLSGSGESGSVSQLSYVKSKGRGKGKRKGKSSRSEVAARKRTRAENQIGGHSGDKDACSMWFKGAQTMGGICVSAACMPLACCGCGPVRQISEGQRGILMTFGKLSRVLEPGTYHANPCTQEIRRYTVALQSLDVPRQSVLTTDDVTLDVDAVVFVRIFDVVKAAFAVENYREAVVNLAAASLVTVVGNTSLEHIFQERGTLNDRIKDQMQLETDEWGIEVDVEIADVVIPTHMQRSLAAAAEAKRDGKAKLVTARAEKKASTILQSAAELMENPIALQLRYFQTLSEIAAENNSTVIVPSGMHDLATAAAGARAGK
ncbi:uncharacterized protein AMSG_10077 [Thecamonas trahens ATCC 50062]|uniref:Band 7 domain-containing protein n=1 Tax=Thecamonas trahens ATCC 50062 TaxID=461836 RepID=A0A0L0DS52_THETB|nr:hypothetical protein AMSG_10077 [Thecamonas trahens ATCC 50062]KNC54278.1 hypothetical protein AMSG_10077 [Thecamonas trahens ATCC 50062]|eukprot:XP_013753910.1 hypothetical protein AMSG_10077 [Thecamonas trahens ATCC 50062]